MNPRSYLAVGAIAASCVLPASASAATASSASVRADVGASMQAFEKVHGLTEAGRGAAAAANASAGLRKLRSAARTANRMRRSAHGDRAVGRVVRAERLIGQSAAESADLLAGAVPGASASVDVRLAGTSLDLLMLHEQAIDILAGLVGAASQSSDAAAITAIGDLIAGTIPVVGALTETLASGGVALPAVAKLASTLQLVTETITNSMAILQGLPGIAIAAAAVQPAVEIAAGQVTGALEQAQAMLQALTASVGPPAAAGTVGSMVSPTLNSLLGTISLALAASAEVDA